MPKPALPRPFARRPAVRALVAALVACAAAFAGPHSAIAETPPPRDAQGLADQLVSRAKDLLGVPYKWGGNAPETGLDCSGLVRHVFEDAAGLVLPRRAIEMSRTGAPVDRGELQPGDLVFFNTLRRAFSHVGIYIGNGKFIHAENESTGVVISDLGSTYYSSRWYGARRIG
jgi:cell wall-associated NlpC family hydrolase